MRRLVRHPLALDALVALALGALAQTAVWRGQVAGPRELIAPLFFLLGPPLVFRRRLPLLPTVAATTAIAVQALVTQDAAEGAGLFLPAVVALYSAAAWGSRWVALAGLTIAAAGTLIHDLEDRHLGTSSQLWAAAFFWLFTFAAWLAGLFVRARREAAAHDRRAHELERERAEAISSERARIARELHDVIAHSISVVVLQAVAAMGILDREPERVREPLGRIEQSGREALAELRRLLGIVRSESEDGDLAPQPGLDDLDKLLESVRSTGLAVELNVEGTSEQVPRGVDLSAYRIIQESLTNTLKHAGPASARVHVRYLGDWLELEIADDGRGEAAANGIGGGGRGLVGMQERAALYGGELQAGPQNGGGFTVRARLPLEARYT